MRSRDQNVLKWFGTLGGIGKNKMVKKVYRAGIKGNKIKERPCRKSRDEGKEFLMGGG